MARKSGKLVIRIEPELREAIAEAAREREQAVGDLVRRVMRSWLRQQSANARSA